MREMSSTNRSSWPAVSLVIVVAVRQAPTLKVTRTRARSKTHSEWDEDDGLSTSDQQVAFRFNSLKILNGVIAHTLSRWANQLSPASPCDSVVLKDLPCRNSYRRRWHKHPKCSSIPVRAVAAQMQHQHPNQDMSLWRVKVQPLLNFAK